MSLKPIFLCIKIISYIMDILNEITLKLSIMFEFNLIQGLCFNNTRTNMWHMTQKFYKTIQWGKTLVFASKFRVMNLVLSYGASYEWTFFCVHFCVFTKGCCEKISFWGMTTKNNFTMSLFFGNEHCAKVMGHNKEMWKEFLSVVQRKPSFVFSFS
jgi:hypothetical protein